MLSTLKQGLNYPDALENIGRHKNRTETFLESPSIGWRHLETNRALPLVSSKRILIVDDSEPIIEFLGGVFEDTGIVETAMDGDQALRKTKEYQFDVFISDVNMWGIFGIEFYR